MRISFVRAWETFFANAGLVQVMKANDLSTADYFSRRAGMTTRRSRSETQGGSSTSGGQTSSSTRSWSFTSTEIEDALVPPTLLFSLPLGRVLSFVDHCFPVMAQLVPYYEDETLAGLYDPDPEHMPVGEARALIAEK